jgi:glycosyltransferase involved in cell wall biosynthesis
MKICIVIYQNPWAINSASSNRLLSLIEGLSALNVDLHILIYGGYLSRFEFETWSHKGTFNNVKYEYLFTKIIEGYLDIRFNNYVGQHLRKFNLFRRITYLVNQSKSIVWTDSSQFGFELAHRLRDNNPKCILFTEMSEFLDIHLNNKVNFLQRFVENKRRRFFEKKAFYVYNGIALMTKTLMKHYASFNASQPVLLHLPMTVDLERFDTNPDSLPEFKKPYIAFVGVMNDAKDGVSLLIRAFQKVKDKYPLLNLYLVGPWHYDTPRHLELINEFQLKERVFWLKEYKRAKIPGIICHAEVLVLPRPDSKQAQGGFPTKLGEYLATGNPVCSTRVGEIPDYLIDNESVFFANPDSPDSFACALERALSNPEKASIVGKNGRKLAEREFNKNIQSLKLLSFLNILEGKKQEFN